MDEYQLKIILPCQKCSNSYSIYESYLYRSSGIVSCKDHMIDNLKEMPKISPLKKKIEMKEGKDVFKIMTEKVTSFPPFTSFKMIIQQFSCLQRTSQPEDRVIIERNGNGYEIYSKDIFYFISAYTRFYTDRYPEKIETTILDLSKPQKSFYTSNNGRLIEGKTDEIAIRTTTEALSLKDIFMIEVPKFGIIFTIENNFFLFNAIDDMEDILRYIGISEKRVISNMDILRNSYRIMEKGSREFKFLSLRCTPHPKGSSQIEIFSLISIIRDIKNWANSGYLNDIKNPIKVFHDKLEGTKTFLLKCEIKSLEVNISDKIDESEIIEFNYGNENTSKIKSLLMN